MIRSYRSKLVASFLAVTLLLLVLLGSVGYSYYKNTYLANLETRLTREAYLVADMTRFRAGDGWAQRSYSDICTAAARDSATRVTIIDSRGAVLGDSEVDPSTLDNHSSRPEVYIALQGQAGVDIRYSDTLAMNMLYVAIPFSNDEDSGAVRLALPLAELQAIYSKALTGILLATFLCGLIAVLLGLWLAQRFSQPVKDITRAVKDLAGGNLRRRISVHSGDEIEELAHAFNDMAQHIEKNIDEVTEVRNYLQAILDNTVNGVLMIGRDDRVVYANPVSASLLALGNEIPGKKYVEIITTYELLAMIDEVKQNGQSIKRSIALHTLGGRIIEANALPLYDSSISVRDILVILNDITEIKHLEQVRKDFVANVSHELKTPVASISGFAETLLAEGGKDPVTTQEFIRIMYKETQRLSRLINDLLELSQLEADAFKLQRRQVDLNRLVEDAVTRMATTASFRNIEINYFHPDTAVQLNSDPGLIDLILINLLDNAVNYSTDGGRVEVGLEDLGDKVKISVKDNGIGIPARDITRIFERFYRVDKARTRKTGGTGLGLSIVKHIAENLNGQVAAESTEGRGSAFYVTLPKM